MSLTRSSVTRELVIARVREADPTMAADQVAAALDAVAVHPAVLRSLGQALSGGAGALLAGAPPAAGKLVNELRRRGSALPEPTCARCGQTSCPLTASAEGGVCARCRSRQLACVCASCGVVKPVAGRDGQGQPLCACCAPRPKRPCARCGRTRVVALRARDGQGDLCDRCYKGPGAKCLSCGRQRPCNFLAEGRPICISCSPRRQLACAHCGELKPPCAHWPEGPVCEPCYRAARGRRGCCAACSVERRLVWPPGPGATHCASCAGAPGLANCAACGADERPYKNGLCVRCALAERAREVLGDGPGPLSSVRDALVGAPQPYSAHNWLRSGVSAGILADVASGALALTHEALDHHPRPRAANYLRHVLVAHGALPERDDALARLEAWVAARLSSVAPQHRQALRSYATWRVLRRARQRAEVARRPPTRTARAKTCLNAAMAFLSFLDEQGTDLRGAAQADMDTWLSTGPPSAPEVADFIDWAMGRKLCGRLVVGSRRSNEGLAMDDDARFEVVRRLLHDDSLEVADRVAGCLVLLYGQQISRIVTLRRDQLDEQEDALRLHLGPTSIEVPEPLASLLKAVARSRRPKVGVVPVRPSPWLVPGLDPGQPLNAAYLGGRLRRLGVATMPGRRRALVHLAGQLPAAVLADLLGIRATTAVYWSQAAGSDWTTYAAELVMNPDRDLTPHPTPADDIGD